MLVLRLSHNFSWNCIFWLILVTCSAFPSTLNQNERHLVHRSKHVLQRLERSSGCRPGELLSKDKGGCYKEETQGPCGKYMIFHKTLEDSSMGRCDCDFMKSPGRALIYHPSTDQCYQIYTRGPCDSASWLVIKNGNPACESNPCLYETYFVTYEGKDFVYYEDECVELNQPSSKCGSENEIISLIDKGQTPACVKKLALSPLSIMSSLRMITCPEGTILQYDNTCLEPVEFDINE